MKKTSQNTWFGKHAVGISLILILLVGLWWRVYALSYAPPAAVPDEIHYGLSAKSVAYFGTDLSQTTSIFSLQPFITGEVMSELGALFQLPTMAWLPTNHLTLKIMPVIFSILLILGTYVLVRLLFEGRALALGSALVVAVNPWAIFIGRTGYDGPVALSLFVWSFVFLVLLAKSKTKLAVIGWSSAWLVIFSWAFFTYQGMKIPGVALTVIMAGYLWFKQQQKRSVKTRWLLVGVGLIAVLIFVINAASLVGSGHRTSEISVLNFAPFTEESNLQRRLNLAPNSLLTRVINNSRAIWFFNLIGRYGMVYDLHTLFISGIPQFTSSVANYGAFHLFELLFLVYAGYLLLEKKKHHQLFFLGALLLAAPLTFAIRNTVTYYAYQNCFLIIILAVMIAWGMVNIWRRWGRVSVVIIAGCYLVSLLVFGHNYFVRYPVYAEEQWYFKNRLLSHYLGAITDRPLLVISPQPKEILRNYVFYTNAYQREAGAELAAQFKRSDEESLVFRNLTASVDCNLLSGLDEKTVVVLDPAVRGRECDALISSYIAEGEATMAGKIAAPRTEINFAALKDSGTTYRIFNDPLCNVEDLPAFIHLANPAQLQVENLTQEQFCQTYLVKYFN